MKPTLMLIGLGDLGSIMVEFLEREEQLGKIVAADLDKTRGIARCNLARLSAMAQGYSPSMSFVHLDINHRETVKEIIQKENPEIILSTASMLTWWLPDFLPSEQSARIKSAGFGVWLPVHLTLSLNLAHSDEDVEFTLEAVRKALKDV
jgi:selenocysteine lyase/cysteine desulfurase